MRAELPANRIGAAGPHPTLEIHVGCGPAAPEQFSKQ